MNETPFIERMLPYARQASDQTGLPVSVILAQWALESGWGTAPAKNGTNNYAGIMVPLPTGQALRSYTSIDAFVTDYVRVVNLSQYGKVRAKAKAGASPLDVAEELGKSPWDAGHYQQVDPKTGKPVAGTDGFALTAIINQYGLARYSGKAAGLDPAQPVTAAQLARLEAAAGFRLSDQQRGALMSPATSAADRAAILAQLDASPGQAVAINDPLSATADAGIDAAKAIASPAKALIELGQKALGVLTSAEFWRRAGLVAGGVALLGVGLFILAKD